MGAFKYTITVESDAGFYRDREFIWWNKVEDEKSVDDISTKREAVDNVMLNYTKKKSSSFRPQFVQKVN